MPNNPNGAPTTRSPEAPGNWYVDPATIANVEPSPFDGPQAYDQRNTDHKRNVSDLALVVDANNYMNENGLLDIPIQPPERTPFDSDESYAQRVQAHEDNVRGLAFAVAKNNVINERNNGEHQKNRARNKFGSFIANRFFRRKG